MHLQLSCLIPACTHATSSQSCMVAHLYTHTHLYLHTQSTHLAVAADRSGPWAAAAAVEVSTWMTSLMGPMPAKLSSARS